MVPLRFPCSESRVRLGAVRLTLRPALTMFSSMGWLTLTVTSSSAWAVTDVAPVTKPVAMTPTGSPISTSAPVPVAVTATVLG